jgi:hypothetical protein
MNDLGNGHKVFRTLRGFLSGNEPDEENRFAYSATLRILGEDLDFDDISAHLGFLPTRSHRKGDRKGPNSPPSAHDMWTYSPQLDESVELEKGAALLKRCLVPPPFHAAQANSTA